MGKLLASVRRYRAIRLGKAEAERRVLEKAHEKKRKNVRTSTDKHRKEGVSQSAYRGR